jgi:nucleoside 2-deoxyribosyltransferase
MVKVYTAGYMAGDKSDRFDWRVEAERIYQGTLGDYAAQNNIKWLHPGVPDGAIPGQGNPDIYTPRDVLQIRKADILLAYIDLEVARCLGAAWEMGMAYATGKPVIMVDMSPEIGSLDLQRSTATSVWTSLEDGVKALAFVAQGF